ncbi:MAG: UrcA family protein [Pseudomonadota bacterium]
MKTAIATAAIASFAFAPAALAAERFEVEFTYAPAEVATEEGAEATYNELEAMIEDECSTSYVPRSYSEKAAADACIDQALANAVDQIDKPEVTRIHQERRG